MIAQATITDTHIEVKCPARMKELIAEIPGSRFQARSADLWRLPRTLNAAVQLVGQLGFAHLELSDELRAQIGEWKDVERAAGVLREMALDPAAWADQPDGMKGYQLAGYNYLRGVDSAVLGDDPGTGKTIIAANWLREGPSLIVCPKAVQENWRKELLKFRPDLPEALVLDGSATQRRKLLAGFDPANGILICSYDQLPIHSRLAPYGAIKLTEDQKTDKELNAVPWVSIIADEAHRMFNPKTRWTRAFWWLRMRAQRGLIMTGTPSENSPLDFLSLLHAAAPDEWPSRSKAQSYYMVSSPGFFGGVEVTGLRVDRRDEWDRLVALRFLRRPKALVLPFLPPKVYESRTVALSPKLRKQYTELKKEMMVDLDAGTLMVQNSAVLHTRLVQAASATLEITGHEEREVSLADGSTELRQVPIVRMAEPSPKVDGAVEVIGDLGDQPVMISARSRQLLDLLAARLTKDRVPFSMIAGGMRPDEIEYAKDEYNSGRVNILLLSVSSAAEGLSLTRGSTIIRLDRSPKRRDNVQATDRLHGTGRGDHSAEHLLIIDLITEDTVEHVQLDSLADKDAGAEELFKDEETIRRLLK